jgi:hypothetical protein
MAKGYQKPETLPKGHMERIGNEFKNNPSIIKSRMDEINSKGAHRFKKGYVAVVKHFHSKLK